MTIFEEAQALLPSLVAWRRQLHEQAESGYDLPQTLALIRDVLTAHRVSFSEPCRSTIVAEIGNGPVGMILRADTDALPMDEESGLEFASRTAFAHTCGHDFHTAMLLGAACLLQAHADTLTTRVRLVFQPDEEGATGARHVLDHGIIDPAYRGAFALHLSPVLENGALYYADGPLYAASDECLITVRGASAHGAAPHTGRDPIFAAVQIYNALQGLISREVSAFETAVLSICAFNAGTTYNVVPGEAVLRGTLRTYDDDLRARLKARMAELCEGVARAEGCQANLEFITSLPAVTNDAALNARILDRLRREAPSLPLHQHDAPFSWSEDFGCFREQLPISMMTLGAHVPGCRANIHNADVLFNEEALPAGVVAHVMTALSAQD